MVPRLTPTKPPMLLPSDEFEAEGEVISPEDEEFFKVPEWSPTTTPISPPPMRVAFETFKLLINPFVPVAENSPTKL